MPRQCFSYAYHKANVSPYVKSKGRESWSGNTQSLSEEPPLRILENKLAGSTQRRLNNNERLAGRCGERAMAVAEPRHRLSEMAAETWFLMGGTVKVSPARNAAEGGCLDSHVGPNAITPP